MKRRATQNRSTALLTALLTLIALAVPLVGTAVANHGTRTLQVRHSATATDEITGEGSQPNTVHYLYAVLEDTTGSSQLGANALSGQINIDFEIISGPGDAAVVGGDPGDTPSEPDLTCSMLTADDPTTAWNDTTTCRVGYSVPTTGTDLVRAWIDHDKNDATSGEADLAEGRVADQATDECPGTSGACRSAPVPGNEPEIDDTDVVRVVWSLPSAPLATLDCNPETARNPSTGTGSAETYTCQLKDSQGRPYTVPTGDIYAVDGENLNGANDPDNSANGEARGPAEDPSDPASTCGDDPTAQRDCGDRADYDHEMPTDAGESALGDENHFCLIFEGESECSDSVPAQDGESGSATICFWAQDYSDHGDSFRPELDSSDPNVGSAEGADCDLESQNPTSEDADLTDAVVKTWEARSSAKGGLDAEPETDINNIGDSHTITATVYDQFGEPFVSVTTVRFEFFAGSPHDPDNGTTPNTPDMTCQTRSSSGAATSSCSITYTGTKTGKDLVCAWTNETPSTTGDNTNGTCNGGLGSEGLTDADDTAGTANAPSPENDDVDIVEKNWVDPNTPSRLDCNPETDTNPVGSSHTVTCTVTSSGTDATGSPRRIGNVNVDAEATGANDPDAGDTKTSPDFTCTTASQDDPTTPTVNEQGTCSFTHGPGGRGTTNSTGVTVYRAWIDSDGNDATANDDASETRDEAAAGGAGGTSEPDSTDVVEKTWVAAPTTAQVTPESDTAPVGACNPYTITALNSSGQPVQGAVFDVEQRHAESTDSQANDEPTVSFCTPTEGPNPSDVNTAEGDLGPNSQEQDKENPDNPGTAGGELTSPTDANGKVTFGIRVAPGNGDDGTGLVNITVFYESADNDDPDSGEPSDTATKTWTPAPDARSIDCSPETATNEVGTTHTVTCIVRDQNNQPAQGESVTFTEEGPGEITGGSVKTTDSNGQVSATTTSQEPGEQIITGTITDDTGSGEPNNVDECDKAANDPQGSPAGVCSDSVSKTWTEDDQTPECSDGVDNDDDGEVDFPEDQGCSDIEDDSENTDVQPEETCPGFEGDDRNQVVGTENGETLEGTEGPDIICGLGGDDLIIGFGGDDVLIGGKGNDSLRGDDGDDNLKGGAGKDELRGNADTDTLRGGRQNDDLRGNAGDDHLDGGAGFDVLRGGGGDDRAIGASGNDTLQGYLGNDVLVGNSGNDTIKGADGRDTVKGGKDNDVLSGGAGPDTINGGPGRDVCAGGPGKDSIKNCEA